MKKQFLKSKTVWLGLLTSLGSVVASHNPAAAVSVAENLEIFGGILGALIIGLRAATSTGVRL